MYLKVANEFKKYFGSVHEVIASVPACLDLLNTHQDYKGLPVVSVIANLKLYAALSRAINDTVHVVSHNMKVMRNKYRNAFTLHNIRLLGGDCGNYVRASIAYLRRRGYSIDGFNTFIYSEIPIGAGLGGTVIALVKDLGDANRIMLRSLCSGALRTWLVKEDVGVMVH